MILPVATLFFVTVYLITKQPEIKVKERRIKLDYSLSSLLVLGLLILSDVATVDTIKHALMPKMGIVPWQILIVFFGSAYICSSLDASGLLKVIAYKFVTLSRNNGRRLFYNLVVLAGIMTVFTSNDIVTLTLTPIIVYISQYTGVDPIPYLIPVFFTSNTWSMFFYIGNPTNVIVAQAFSLNFVQYAKRMFFPTIVAIVTSLVGFTVQYRKRLPERVEVKLEFDDRGLIPNKSYAFLSASLFVAFFLLISIGDFLRIELWETIAIFSGIYLVLNLIFSSRMSKGLSFFLDSIARVPWKMLPMVVTFFVFVHILTSYGLTGLLSPLFDFKNELLGTIITAYATAFAANVMINQPMTIFFSHVLWGKSTRYAMSLVIGSNLGGNITLVGALAGIMWSKILKEHGVEMNNRIFVRETFAVAMLTLLSTSAAIYLFVK